MSYVLSLLILVPLLGSGATFLLSSLGGGRRTAPYLAAAFSCATLLVAGYAFFSVYSHTPALGNYALMEDHPWITLPGFGVDIMLGLDGLSAPLVLASGIVAVLSILSSRALIDKEEPAYYALLLLVLASVMGAFTSLNLVVFYLFWELTLIPMFFLIGVWGGDRRKYAALKFIIFTFAGSAVMLLGFLALYFGVSLSTFDIPELASLGIPVGLQYLPLLAVFVGCAVELPVFPFHSWQPDAYEQAPAPVNSLLSGILPKFAGYAVIRIALGLFPQAAYQYAWAFIVVADLLHVLRRGGRPPPERPEADVRLHEHKPHGLRPIRGVRHRPLGQPPRDRGGDPADVHARPRDQLGLHRLGARREAVWDEEDPPSGRDGAARPAHGGAPRRREQRRDGNTTVRELPS